MENQGQLCSFLSLGGEPGWSTNYEGKGRVWDDFGVDRGDWMGGWGLLMGEGRRRELQVEMGREERRGNELECGHRELEMLEGHHFKTVSPAGTLSPLCQQAPWYNLWSC